MLNKVWWTKWDSYSLWVIHSYKKMSSWKWKVACFRKKAIRKSLLMWFYNPVQSWLFACRNLMASPTGGPAVNKLWLRADALWSSRACGGKWTTTKKINLSLLAIFWHFLILSLYPSASNLHGTFFNLVHEDITSLFWGVSAAALECWSECVEISRIILTGLPLKQFVWINVRKSSLHCEKSLSAAVPLRVFCAMFSPILCWVT